MFKIICRTDKREILVKQHYGQFEGAFERMMKLRNKHRADNGMARAEYDKKYVWSVREAVWSKA